MNEKPRQLRRSSVDMIESLCAWSNAINTPFIYLIPFYPRATAVARDIVPILFLCVDEHLLSLVLVPVLVELALLLELLALALDAVATEDTVHYRGVCQGKDG